MENPKESSKGKPKENSKGNLKESLKKSTKENSTNPKNSEQLKEPTKASLWLSVTLADAHTRRKNGAKMVERLEFHHSGLLATEREETEKEANINHGCPVGSVDFSVLGKHLSLSRMLTSSPDEPLNEPFTCSPHFFGLKAN